MIGHYDPSLMYYIRRKGWMEDPYLWTPFDEQSAIRKGARYFIAVEPKRLARNAELSHWLLRFPLLDPKAKWPVYETDPAKVLPGAPKRAGKSSAAANASICRSSRLKRSARTELGRSPRVTRGYAVALALDVLRALGTSERFGKRGRERRRIGQRHLLIGACAAARR